MGERKIGQSPVERVRGNAVNAERSCDVLIKGVEILGTNAGAIEIQPRIVDQLAKSLRVPDRHIKAASAGIASNAGERIGHIRARRVVVEPDVQIISRSTPPTTSLAGGGAAQGLNNADIQVVAVIERGGDEMKILAIGSRLPAR